jgi:hypothetical protein
LDSANALAEHLREQPTLPPEPQDADAPRICVSDGVMWPLVHCAVHGCRCTGLDDDELAQHVWRDHKQLLPEDIKGAEFAYQLYCAAVETKERMGMRALGINYFANTTTLT